MHFFYDAQSRPAMVEFNGAIYSYVHNLQGDIVGILDNAGSLVVEYKYDAWGKPALVRTLTTAYEALAELNPFRYRGYVFDEETGLYYLRSRYYIAKCCRFINPDIFLNKRQLLAHSLYSYCRNNCPIRHDTDGAVDGVIGGTAQPGFWENVLGRVGTWFKSIGTFFAGLFAISDSVESSIEAEESRADVNSLEEATSESVEKLAQGKYYYAFVDLDNNVMVFATPALTMEQCLVLSGPSAWGEYTGYPGGNRVGVYTPLAEDAMNLAAAMSPGGNEPCTSECHAYSTRAKPGVYFNHYHPAGHEIHIWYGLPIICLLYTSRCV